MPERPGRVQRRQQETKERIFRVAMDLFGRKGFENTTVAEITEAADIGKGTFFTYFPTKEAIFGHLGEMLTESMAAAVAASLEANVPAADILSRLFEGAAIWHETNRPLTGQVIMAGLRSSFAMEADAPNQRRMLEILADVIRMGQQCGEFKADIGAEDAAIAMTGAYFSILLAWVSQPEPGPVAGRLQATLRLMIEGLKR